MFDRAASDLSGTQILGADSSQLYSQNANNAVDIKPRAPNAEKNLRSLTIKSIYSGEEPVDGANFEIDGRPVNHVTICGQVVKIEIQSAHTTYTLNDGTAEIKCKVWTNDEQALGGGFDDDGNQTAGDNDDGSAQRLAEDDYAKVYGRLNFYQNTRSVNVFRIRKVTDFNEVTVHFLEVIYAHCVHKYEDKTRSKLMGGGGGGRAGESGGHQQYNQQSQQSTQLMTNGMNNMGFNPMDESNVNVDNELQRKILHIIRQNDGSEEGCNVECVFAGLPNVDVNDIRMEIEAMSTGGSLYSTVDDEHYKYTGKEK